MSLFAFHLSEVTVKRLAAAGLDLSGVSGTEARDDAILAALRELSEEYPVYPPGAVRRPALTQEPGQDLVQENRDKFLAAVLKRLDELATSSILDTRSLATRIAHDLGWDADAVRGRLVRLAHERPDLATQDGPEYRMYGKVVRAWNWHGRKPE